MTKSTDKSAKKSTSKASLKDIADSDQKAPDAKAAETPDVTAQKAKSGGGFMWFIVLVMIIGGSAAAAWPFIGPKVEPVLSDIKSLLGVTPRPTQVQLPTTTESIIEPTPVVEAEVIPEQDGSSAQSGPSEQGAPPEQGALAARLDALENQVNTLGTLSGTGGQEALNATAELARALSDIKDELATLSTRLQALEDGSHADPTAPAQALVLGVTQLRARLTGDSPFAAELETLATIAAGDDAVTAALHRLQPHADVGVPSEAALTARFAKVAKAIMTARSSTEAGGWLATVKSGLGGLVTVRRTDPAKITDEVERAVAIADAALELGELAEAVKALGTLQGGAGDAAAAWLGDASARVNAEAALEDLHSHALAVLSAAGGK